MLLGHTPIFHRMHHAYADRDKDPHKPYPGLKGFFYKSPLTTAIRYGEVRSGKPYITIDGRKAVIEERFKKNLPEKTIVDAIFSSWITRIAWIIVYVFLYIKFLQHLGFDSSEIRVITPIMVTLHSIMAPLHGHIVNWIFHMAGDAPHDTGDTSRNIPIGVRIVIILMLLPMVGEDLHNNHHQRPASSNFAWYRGRVRFHKNNFLNSFLKLFYIDLGYQVLRLLQFIGIIRLKRI